MERLDLQKWIAENKESMRNYKEYLEVLCADLVNVHFDNIKDRELDLVNKGKVQQLSYLIKQLS